ncbi:hypothetical protein pb186bvf_011031 [Paramecium bursaria]
MTKFIEKIIISYFELFALFSVYNHIILIVCFYVDLIKLSYLFT